MHRRTVGLLLVVGGASLFGMLGVFGKVASDIGLSVATLLGIRFLAVSVAYFESLGWLSAGVAALLLFTYPVQVTVASTVALDESLTVPKIIALVTALSGVGAVLSGDPVEIALVGVLLVGLASLCYTVYALGTSISVAAIDRLIHTAYVFFGGSVTVLAYGIATTSLDVPATPGAWSLVAGITVGGTLVPMVLFTAGLARVEASTASIVSTSEPLATVLLGVVALGEPMTPAIGLGALLICVSVGLGTATVERVIHRRLQGWPAIHPAGWNP